MNPTTLTAVLGLSSAVIWGAGDFAGGMSARHLRVLPLVTIAHGFGMACLLALVWFFHQPAPHGMIFGWGVIAGVANGCALLAFYRALSLGNMGATAAISGVLTAALPILFSLVTIGAPLPRQQVGLVLAAVAIWLISSKPIENADSLLSASDPHFKQQQRERWMLAVFAGCGFGIFLIAAKLANPGGLLWPLVTSKIGSLSVMAVGWLFFLALRRRRDARPADENSGLRSSLRVGAMLALVTGIFDTGGNALFIAASRMGRLDIAAVLASLYPASTILLAVWLLRERTSKRQSFGMAAAMVAVALIAR